MPRLLTLAMALSLFASQAVSAPPRPELLCDPAFVERAREVLGNHRNPVGVPYNSQLAPNRVAEYFYEVSYGALAIAGDTGSVPPWQELPSAYTTYLGTELCGYCGICETKCPLADKSAIVVTRRGESRAQDSLGWG